MAGATGSVPEIRIEHIVPSAGQRRPPGTSPKRLSKPEPETAGAQSEPASAGGWRRRSRQPHAKAPAPPSPRQGQAAAARVPAVPEIAAAAGIRAVAGMLAAVRVPAVHGIPGAPGRHRPNRRSAGDAPRRRGIGLARPKGGQRGQRRSPRPAEKPRTIPACGGS